jgi:hypothetical protein
MVHSQLVAAEDIMYNINYFLIEQEAMLLLKTKSKMINGVVFKTI